MIGALLTVTLAAATLPPEQAQAVQKLQEELTRVDRAVDETETLIARTPTARYVPELRFRLCELLVQKSRLTYHLQNNQRGADEHGPLASPEVRLLKEKAVAQYARLLREAPKFAGADKVRFYLAHEQRELGDFDEMVKTLLELSKKHPKSPLARDGELIVADHYFDKADLDEAEKHYQKVLKSPESPAHDLARYKMGWVRVNQGNHEDAITFFAAVVTSKAPVGAESKKQLDIRREALLDLVYSYTEVKPAKGALAYFERMSDSTASYALALDKLAGRYLVKQQPEFAVLALRKLLSLRPDAERDTDRVTALYDAIRDSVGKATPTPADVSYLVRAAVQTRKSIALKDDEKQTQLKELEEMARDLATRLHTSAQKKNDPRLLADAATAYHEYLNLFRPTAHVYEMMKNRADALYASHQYPEAAKQFEAIARRADGDDDSKHEAAVYGALVAWKAALADEELEKRTRFEVVDARQALKRLGGAFVHWYPDNAHASEVQFNIARAHFDDGEYRQASAGFTAFALKHPDHKDAAIAGHLALDALYKLKDYQSLQDTGAQLIAANLPSSFKSEAKKVLKDVEGEALTDLALASAQKTGDVVSGLEKAADEAKDEATAAKTLHAALLAAREKGDYEKERELALKLLEKFPSQPQSNGVTLELARRAADTARFSEAASWFEKAQAYEPAGNLYFALGDVDRGSRAFESAAAKLKGKEKAEVLATLAEKLLEEGENDRAVAMARKAFTLDGANVRAAAVVAEVSAPQRAEMYDTLMLADGEQAARGLWHVAEEDFKAFKKLGGDQLEKKIEAWQTLQSTYARVADMGSPEWAVASLWRVGLGYQELVKSVEAAAGDVDAETRAVIEEQVAPLRQGADQAFATCVQRADEMGVFTDAVVACRRKSGKGEADWAEPGAPTAEKVPAELQAKVDRAKDAASLTLLGTAQLERRDPQAARLTFSRAVELDKTYAPALSGLGYALLQLGEASAAGTAYQQALMADPMNTLARGNLAALRCRFGDTDGARADLDKVSDKSALSGAAADQGWKSCTAALSRR